jgi:hypothetical protein
VQSKVFDLVRPQDVLSMQLRARQVEGTMGSGAKTITLSAGQLRYLEQRTRGDTDPRGQALRLLLDLDDLQSEDLSAGQTGSCQY